MTTQYFKSLRDFFREQSHKYNSDESSILPILEKLKIKFAT